MVLPLAFALVHPSALDTSVTNGVLATGPALGVYPCGRKIVIGRKSLCAEGRRCRQRSREDEQEHAAIPSEVHAKEDLQSARLQLGTAGGRRLVGSSLTPDGAASGPRRRA